METVTYGTGGPFPQGDDAALVTPGVHSDPTNHYQSGKRSIIGPRYFSTLGIRIVSGREFDERDGANTPGSVIVNETLAHKLFVSSNGVGQRVTMFNGLDPDWLATVVGVIADHHHPHDAHPDPTFQKKKKKKKKRREGGEVQVSRVEWNGMEWNGMEWNGMEWNQSTACTACTV